MKMKEREVILDNEEINEALAGEWTQGKKMDLYAKTDGCSRDTAVKNAQTGGLGEVAGYKYFSNQKIKCNPPFFGHLPQNKAIWGNDLILKEKIAIKTAGKKKVSPSEHICIKGQLDSQARRYGLSWTFEYEISKFRGRDPLLVDPDSNVLLVCAHIWNTDENGDELRLNKMDSCKITLRLFYWPEVAKLVQLPKIKWLAEKKRCLYKDDVDHLQVGFA